SVNQGMTLRDIASQRSGLPRMPSNFNPAKTLNPYADYTPELMYEYLDGLMLGRKPGAQYEYSNLGFMLLGDLMERAYGQPYEELVAQIITGPLNMPDTVITLTDEQQTRLALPHSGGYPVKSWDFALPGVGALRSTSADMLNFLAANLNLGDDALGQAMALIRAECYATGTTFVDVCLGIHTYHRYSKLMYQHDGETGGYHSFSAFVPDDGTAVIILANSNYNIDELGLHLLDPAAPLPDLD
ncbi:MAG: serine hydrolase domain-containing protein, partial [Anaerolineaceae bacterium]